MSTHSVSNETRLRRLEQYVHELQAHLAGHDGTWTTVEPLYPLDVAAALVPCGSKRIRTFINRKYNRDRYPKIYMFDRERKRHRVLSASHIKDIRKHMLRGPGLKDVT